MAMGNNAGKYLLGCTLGLALSIHGGASWAQPEQQKTQVPGFERLAVGDDEVTALYDGYNDIAPSLLKGLEASKVRALLARGSMNAEGAQTSFNAFLVNTGKQLILIDTGAGQCIGATAGMLSSNIKAAGYDPAQVQTILLTHMHLDHVCGLVDAQHQPVFANATVYAAKVEADYWLDTPLDSVPAKARELFNIARDSTAPYRAAGRFKTFAGNNLPVAEVTATSEPGHTPGSTSYTFTSQGQSIVFMGDLIHSVAVQFEHPEVSFGFDVDAREAIASRDRVFTEVAQKHIWAAAAHLPFPGIGHITLTGKHFQWNPMLYGPYQRAAKVPLLQ